MASNLRSRHWLSQFRRFGNHITPALADTIVLCNQLELLRFFPRIKSEDSRHGYV